MTATSALLTSSIVMLAPSGEAASMSFKDMTKSVSSYDAVMDLTSRGVINGFEDGTYRPSAPVTRGQAAKLLVEILELDIRDIEDPEFKDVPQTHRFYKYIAALAKEGIINGYLDGNFGVDDSLQRGQMVSILGDAYKFGTGNLTNNPFTDVNVNAFYAPYLQSLIDHKITFGLTETSFGPSEIVDRGQMAMFLYRSDAAKHGTYVNTTIADVKDGKVITSDGSYAVSDSVKELFKEANAAALKGAQIVFRVNDDNVSRIDQLELKITGDKSVNLDLASVEIKGNLLIHSTVPTVVTGSGEGKNISIGTAEKVTLNLTGKIDSLTLTKDSNVELSTSLKVENLILPAGSKAEELISNYSQVKGNIENVDGKENADQVTPPSSGGGSTNPVTPTPVDAKGEIGAIEANHISIGGKKYKVDSSLKELFSANNSEALKGATLSFETVGTSITKVKGLTLKKSTGLESESLTLNGEGAVIHGSVTVDGDNYVVENLTVNGDFTITDKVTTSFESNGLTVMGTTHIAEAVEQQMVSTAAFSVKTAESPKTRVTIIFNDSTMAVIEIAKKDVYFSATGSTKVTELSLFANANITANPNVIIPKVSMYRGVTQVELNASIKEVIIDSNDELNLSGSGNFENVTVNTDKKVTLSTIGFIKNLDMHNEQSTVSIGDNAVIGDIALPEGKTVEDIVENFKQAKDKIDKIAGEQNPEFNEDLREKENEKHFAAGILQVHDRFGYVKLNVMNQGDSKVKYLLVDRNEDFLSLPKVGDKAPSEAIDYREDEEFILWFNHEIFVYQVDDNNEIIEVIDVNEVWSGIMDVKLNTDNTLTMKTTFKVDDNSVADIMRSVYVYQEGKVNKITNFSKL